MKTIQKIFSTLLIFFLVFIGCSDDFLVDIPPQQSPATYYKNEQHAIETITTCYDPLKHPTIFNQNFFFMFTTWSDRAVHEDNVFNNMNITPTNGFPFYTYTRLYKGIYRCNVALQKIPPIEMDNNLKNRLISEAKFLRSMYNFYLTVLYYEPPLVLEPLDDILKNIPNTDNDKFFSQIISDLNSAAKHLPNEYGEKDLGRATKGAAYALLGKTYLYKASHAPAANVKEDFQNAKDAFMKVKNLADEGFHGLMMPQGTDSLDYAYAYQCNFSAIDFNNKGNAYDSENNLESIFEIQFHYGGWEQWEGGWQADGSLTCLYYGPDGYKNLIPTREYVENVFEDAPADHPAGLKKDPRRYATIYEPGDTIIYLSETNNPPTPWKQNEHTNASISQGYGWQKYFYPSHEGNNGPTNLRVIRYSDVLLMLAEAEYQLNGSSALALECINAVRERAGMSTYTSITKDEIIHERDVEFGFEILRFHDLVRWSMFEEPWVDIEDILRHQNFEKGKHEYLPIPQSEIDIMNGALKQNPGWE